jgi:hypothetical protein
VNGRLVEHSPAHDGMTATPIHSLDDFALIVTWAVSVRSFARVGRSWPAGQTRHAGRGIASMKLRLMPISRIIGSAFWLFVTIPIALLAARNPLAIVVVTVPLVVLGAVLSARMYEAGVDCTSETVTIRGYLWSRRIPIGDVVGVDTSPYASLFRGPALRWTDRRGRVRTSRISAFGWARGLSVNAHSEESLRRLSEWLARERSQHQPGVSGSPRRPQPAAIRSYRRRKRRKKRHRT